MGLLRNLAARVNLLIYQYEVCTSMAMMSFPEKVVISILSR